MLASKKTTNSNVHKPARSRSSRTSVWLKVFSALLVQQCLASRWRLVLKCYQDIRRGDLCGDLSHLFLGSSRWDALQNSKMLGFGWLLESLHARALHLDLVPLRVQGASPIGTVHL